MPDDRDRRIAELEERIVRLERLLDETERRAEETMQELLRRNVELRLQADERHQAEAELHETRSLLMAAVDGSQAGIAIADAPTGRLRYVNDAGLLIRGGDRRSIVEGVGIDEYVARWRVTDRDGHPLSPDEVPLARAILYGEPCEREFVIWRTDDDPRTVLAKAAPVWDETGRITSGVVVFMDITERRATETALISANRRLEALWSVSSLADADLQLISDHILASIVRMTGSEYGFYGFVDPSGEAMTIHSWSGAAMRDCAMATKPTRFPIATSGVWAEAVRTRSPLVLNDYAADHPAKHGLPGGHVPLRNLLVVPFLSHGRVSAVAAVANRAADYADEDVAQLVSFLTGVQAVVESKTAEASLRASERKYRTLFDTMAQGVVYHAADGRIVDANPAAERILGLTLDQMRGKTPLDPAWRTIREDGRPFPGDELPGPVSLRTGEPVENVLFGVFHPEEKSHRWILVSAAPQFDESSGAITGTIATFTDVTERRRLEARLLHSQKIESIGRLAGGVAHDFNNMLSVILGHVEAALQRTEPGGPLEADLVPIREAANRSAELTRQLLTFARMQAVSPVALDLNDAVARIIRMLPRLIGENVRLEWLPAPEPVTVRMDRSHLHQILVNLCVNARDAISDVGTIRIEAGAETAPGRPGEGAAERPTAVLRVSDDGCGMDANMRAHIFEPFYTTKEPGKGTGLGLATVLGAVEQSGGTIEVESAPGRGTVFTLRFPRIAERPAPDEPAPAAPDAAERGRILVVEDEPALLSVLANMLRRSGYEVLATGDTDEAIRIAETSAGAIDLLLTDLVMPKMNGRTLAAAVRRIRPGIRTLFMSGYDDRDSGRDDEGTPVLGKPFTIAALLEIVGRAIRPA